MKKHCNEIFKTLHYAAINYATDILKENTISCFCVFIVVCVRLKKWKYILPSNENGAIFCGYKHRFDCSGKSIKHPLPIFGREDSGFKVIIRDEAEWDAGMVPKLNGQIGFLSELFALSAGGSCLNFLVSYILEELVYWGYVDDVGLASVLSF